MAEFREDTTVYPKMVELAACVCQELIASGLPEPCFCGVLPGAVPPLAYCEGCDGGDGCTNGQAWVRLSDAFTAVALGVPADQTSCGTGLSFTIEVGVVRCMTVIHNDGSPATLAEQLEATRLQLADMAAMRRAISCCFGGDRDEVDVLLGDYSPIGPEGGCVGGFWNVQVGVVR